MGEQTGQPKSGQRPAGASEYLAVTSVMCGFAFAGLVLYLGAGPPAPSRVVAAALLLAAFVTLLYAAFAIASLADVSARGKPPRVWHYFREALWSMLLGMLLLLASTCVMAFLWSNWLGWSGLTLSALFLSRFVWAALRDRSLAAASGGR